MTLNQKRLLFLLPLAVFLGFALIAGLGLYGTITGTRKTENLSSVLIGKAAPSLPQIALNGDAAADLAAYRGRPILVNFMASWCLPCRAELPALDLLGGDVLGGELVIIGIAYKDKAKDTAAFLEQYGNPYDAVFLDNYGQAGVRWGIYGVPESFIIDADGRVILRHAGPIFRDVIDDVIRPQLEAMK